MKLEIDIPEHHYNNIMAFDSVCLGRVPYKGIIMYAINAIKHGKVLDQEPTNKNFTKADIDAIVKAINGGWEQRVNKIRDQLTLKRILADMHLASAGADDLYQKAFADAITIVESYLKEGNI